MYSAAFAWARAISYVEEQLGALITTTWLDDAEIVGLEDDRMIICSPSDFRREQIRRNCQRYIEEALKELYKRDIQLVVWGRSELQEHRDTKAIGPVWIRDPNFSFENFIAGTSNPIPLRAAIHVARHPGDPVYDPLYLYGAPGVGKTHLLYAIANAVAERFPEKKLVYVRGEQFTNELVRAIQTSGTMSFKKRYREADVLLVDDIQFIAGKESTQEEFFHTFNHLYEHGKQIVITSDRRPSDMATLEDRLKGRFGVGVMVQITPPDADTRVLIVRDKAKKLGLGLDEASVEHIAHKLCDDVRQIEGGLHKIRAFHDLSDMPLTVEHITQVLADMGSSGTEAPIDADTVLRYVCRYYGVEQKQIMSQQRSRNVAEPRRVAMYLIRSLTKLSFPDIGRYFGRDHGTVHHAVKKMESDLKSDGGRLAAVLQDIEASIKSNT
ncbi:MAG: chromosomal replication initiator protein DnaA [Oscillospiraceae bacterium]|nr:chromosomal replication initiator protein DnaA [Oscillospiraceae bacterium]